MIKSSNSLHQGRPKKIPCNVSKRKSDDSTSPANIVIQVF